MYIVASQTVVNFVEENAFINNESLSGVMSKGNISQQVCHFYLLLKGLHSHSNNFQDVIEI
jgi:hypothetical protein